MLAGRVDGVGPAVEVGLDAVEDLVVELSCGPVECLSHLDSGEPVAGVGDEDRSLARPGRRDIQVRSVLVAIQRRDMDLAGLALDLVGGAGVAVVAVRQQHARGHCSLSTVVEADPFEHA